MTREEAIKYLEKHTQYKLNGKDLVALDMAIKALEQTRWIPISEGLPEERLGVLVYCPERNNIYCACLDNNKWWIFGGYSKLIEDVTAWMPLPQPYNGESEDKEEGA